MRMMLKVHVPVEDGNESMQSGDMQRIIEEVIPTRADHHALAQLRRPMDMMIQGWLMRRFHASQQWSMRSV